MFRKYRGFSEKYSKWIYGFYVKCRSKHYILQEYNDAGYDERWETSEWIEVEEKSIGIHTTLSGFWEGDIVKYQEYNGHNCSVEYTQRIRPIVFSDGCFSPYQGWAMEV